MRTAVVLGPWAQALDDRASRVAGPVRQAGLRRQVQPAADPARPPVWVSGGRVCLVADSVRPEAVERSRAALAQPAKFRDVRACVVVGPEWRAESRAAQKRAGHFAPLVEKPAPSPGPWMRALPSPCEREHLLAVSVAQRPACLEHQRLAREQSSPDRPIASP